MNAKAAADAAAVAATDVEGLQVFMLRQNQFRSQDDSSISARPSLLLQPLHLHGNRTTKTTTTVTDATSDPDRQDCKRDRRCGSVGDRVSSQGISGVSGMMGMIMPMPKPNPEPIEICIDLERIQPPVEYGVLAKVAMI